MKFVLNAKIIILIECINIDINIKLDSFLKEIYMATTKAPIMAPAPKKAQRL